MRAMRLLLLLLLLSAPLEAQWWKVETSGIDTNLRSVSVARASHAKGASPWVVWASGSNGVILKSADEGETWKRLHMAGGEALDFRGIVASARADSGWLRGPDAQATVDGHKAPK